jgi:hypothetical protein
LCELHQFRSVRCKRCPCPIHAGFFAVFAMVSP